ncbi:hypothetical protein SH1V18_21010 [Vallitalea longa]|uniref:Uncharacterized protein n=1 Tax=Vallitalea longa TaxID=2936439 RepID=A0A9W5YBU6_9FIRM|nr:hypothetical protein [Vallitalea longa]GKX29621.1 hypothetical protein SH1V18_21010 [Vallitalea longa]
MFSIKVISVYDMRHFNTVVISGEVKGSLKNGDILIDKENPNHEYITKGLVIVDGGKNTYCSNVLNIQLVSGNYLPENLIGKSLINRDS